MERNTVLIEIHESGSKFRGFFKDTVTAKKEAVKVTGKRFNVMFTIAKVQSDFNVIGGKIKKR